MSVLLPWLSLVVVIWLQSIIGTNTNFAAYSCLLKSRLGITQVQLNNLAFASDAGKLFGWSSGVAAASRLPQWSILAVGLASGSIGYGVQFLCLRYKIAALRYWQYFLLQLLAGNSICWVNTACYVSAMRKFPVDRGFVLGLATSYTGLSAKIYVVVAQMIAGPDSDVRSVYLLLNCLVPVGVGLVGAPFLAEAKPAVAGTGAGLLAVFVLAVATGGYAVADTLIPELRSAKVPPEFLLVMVAMVAGVVPFLMFWKRKQKSHPAAVGAAGEQVVGEEGAGDDGNGPEGEDEAKKEAGSLGVGHQVLKLARSVEFWLYFLVYLSGGTMGLVYSNNLGQIAKSRGVEEAVLLSISSSFGFFGKLSSAPMSLFTRSKYTLSRPAVVALLMVPLAGSFFLLLVPSKGCLFAGTAIIGVCTGAITSVAVSMTSDLFGAEHFGVSHNIVVANIPVGSLVFGYVAAVIYDREGGGGGRGFCVGVRCYQTTFIIWGTICSMGTMLSLVLYIRTRGMPSTT